MISDEKLLMLLRRNPEKGLDKLMDIYAGLVYTIVYSKLKTFGTQQDVEECVSDVFYAFYQQSNRIDLEKGSVKAYLSVLARRKAIDTFRKVSRPVHQTVSFEVAGLDDSAGDRQQVEEGLIEKETRQLLIQEIKGLGEPDSEILILKFFFGCSTKVIAHQFNLKENTVDKKVSRGLNKLKAGLGGVL